MKSDLTKTTPDIMEKARELAQKFSNVYCKTVVPYMLSQSEETADKVECPYEVTQPLVDLIAAALAEALAVPVEPVPTELAEWILAAENKGNTTGMVRLQGYTDTRLAQDLSKHIPQWGTGSVELLVIEAVRRLFMPNKQMAVPDGWKLVRKEPLEETIQAMHHAYWATLMDWREVYRAMLAAAPNPPIAM